MYISSVQPKKVDTTLLTRVKNDMVKFKKSHVKSYSWTNNKTKRCISKFLDWSPVYVKFDVTADVNFYRCYSWIKAVLIFF